MGITRYDESINKQRSPEEVNLLIASSLEFIQNYISTKGDKELVVQTDFYKQITDCYRIWQRGGDNIVSSVLDMMVLSATNYGATIYSKKKGDSEIQDFLNYWKNNVNRGAGIDIPTGLDNITKEWYTEAWGSRLITLYMVWGTMDYNKKTYQVPIQIFIPNTYGIGIIPSEFFGGNKYFFRSKQDINDWTIKTQNMSQDIYKDPLKYQSLYVDNIKRQFLPLQANHSVKVTRIGASNRMWEVLPVPYLYHKQTAALVKVKEAIRNSDYRTAIGIVNDLLLIKKGSDELTKRGIVYGEPELTALNSLLKEKLSATGILGTSYDTTVEHVTPDVAAMLSKDKYSEIDMDIYASLGLISINIENERVRTSELNPKGLILEISGCMKTYKDLIEKEVFYEIVKRNKDIIKDAKSEDYVFHQKPMNIWISDEGKRLRRLLYEEGLVSKREAIETLAESDYDVQKVQRDSEEKDTKTFYPPVKVNVEKDPDAPTSPDGGRPDNTNKDTNNPDATPTKQNKTVVDKNVGAENYVDAPAKLEACVTDLMSDPKMIEKYPDLKERKSHAFAICQASVMKKGLMYRDEKWSEFDKQMADKTFAHEMNIRGYYKNSEGDWVKAKEE